MQSKLPPSKVSNRITNPNFFKSPPNNNANNNSTTTTNKVQNSANVVANKGILQKLKSARLNSTINIANMNLEQLPQEIFDDKLKFDDINWWDMVEIKKLDASNNKLTSECFENKSEIYNFNLIPALNYCKFSINLFQTIPESIFTLHMLKYLDFSNNKIQMLSPSVKSLKSLVELNISNNQISFLPDEIGYLRELEIITINFNRINLIPESIGNLIKLKRLDASDNNLTTLPSNFNNLSLLEELLIFKNKITSDKYKSFSLEELKNLKYLDMHNNLIVEFHNLPFSEKLDTLILGYNRLEKISSFKNAPNLTVIDLNNNKLESFPEEILHSKEVKTLNLMNNSINDIPPQVCFLKNLVRISLDGNPLKKLNSKVRSSNAETLKAYLKTRLREEDILVDMNINDIEFTSNKLNNNNQILNYLHNNNLSINNLGMEEIPIDQMNKCINLKFVNSIDFSNNNIKSLDNFKYLSQDLSELREIKFSVNKIDNFPEMFLNFFNLKLIDLKNNLLTNFLENIFAFNKEFVNNLFPNLEYLDLSINKFKSIPSILNYLTKLNVFLMSNNNLTDISNLYFSEFSRLDTLDLGTNKIEQLKDKMYKNFPNLKNLNLENNEIKFFPTDICLLSLNKLNINGNPIRSLRGSLISGGSKNLLDYLKKMHKFDAEDFEFEKMNMAKQMQTQVNVQMPQENKIKINNDQQTSTKKVKSELDEINDEILQVEAEMANNPGMPMFKRTDLRKKLNSLIRLRSSLLK